MRKTPLSALSLYPLPFAVSGSRCPVGIQRPWFNALPVFYMDVSDHGSNGQS
ncbi:hypothetical protein ANDA3_0279 [plant metagenome]|uniref:Uncharacterized protein n=2 Tax=root TaxID=1 RepID=A0A1C3K700_9BURK|nr:hypothetical protein ODI_03331 [Orrella dioscoreae]SOE46135.1 hypothetical protein ODI_R0152 [Orrella dioscoreae]